MVWLLKVYDKKVSDAFGLWVYRSSKSMPLGWSTANALVFRKVRRALGLDRCKMCLTAAAPIMRDTLDFFASLNIPIMEIYGMSETSGKFL